MTYSNAKEVILTKAHEILSGITPLIADLAHDLPAPLRYQRLLDTVRSLLPCDAVALLRLEGDSLVPLAIHGLSADTLGRRFKLADQPRLRAILAAPQGLRFPPDCDLPDPYDGLVQADSPHLEVHDCMGCTLRLGDEVWGLLTLDALQAGSFTSADLETLQTFASLASATVAADARLRQLARRVEDESRKVEAYRQTQAPTPAFIGQSEASRQLLDEIALVAPSDLTVLISGETGVGKELVARQLHAQSTRALQAMVSVNCAALPEHLVESELFGHVRGAFSGAIGNRSGKFEMANGGSLFLDEVGELPLAAQAKLLRVLQDGQLQRIGSDREHHANVRLIAATNRDLAEEVRAGRFRADLYHRLSIFPLRVPPLRARGDDVLLLAGYFIEVNRRRMGLRGLRLAKAAEQALQEHYWPGNVRELEYLIARAALKALGRQTTSQQQGLDAARSHSIVTLEPEDLGMPAQQAPIDTNAQSAAAVPALPLNSSALGLRQQVDALQRQLLTQAWHAAKGNTAAAARRLDLDRANFVRLAQRLGVITHLKKTEK
ncbi:nitric oxide reductase transcriptional regulator NorR [Lampropedia puyangensis]|uniref:Nitric oxide reductase transcriptional regulator NorR n=1 Tax=Lampropedia puyangensis TaxID=1330072 RepID=A0A4S8FEJ0_9BURK|nr:nitric oxide reductase transcriptional regulator NorR [Lampropedia puyangensis]THU05094.1 nitric oxide reductase transcriptional regulator NorR [Lampropedia puyangensis]